MVRTSEPRYRPGRAWIGFIIGAAILLLGLLLDLAFVSSYLDYRRSGDWPTVPCAVLTSRLEKDTAQMHGGPSTTYQAMFTYRYQFGGIVHVGHDYGFFDQGGSLDVAERELRQFPAGKSATCWVNPRHPGIAVLSRSNVGMGTLMWVGIVITLIGLGFLVGVLISQYGMYISYFLAGRGAR